MGKRAEETDLESPNNTFTETNKLAIPNEDNTTPEWRD